MLDTGDMSKLLAYLAFFLFLDRQLPVVPLQIFPRLVRLSPLPIRHLLCPDSNSRSMKKG